jgi:ribosomal-protein-alanine N-acetyltransferase
MKIIETARLRLRPFAESDLEALVTLNSDREVMKYITDGAPMTREQSEARFEFYLNHWQQYGFGLFAIEYKDTDEFAGFCGMQYLDNTAEIEVGYRLARNYWGKGIATESSKACLKFGFDDLNLDRIVAVVRPDNLASQQVLEKIGLRYEKRAHYYNVDVMYYALNRNEYKR